MVTAALGLGMACAVLDSMLKTREIERNNTPPVIVEEPQVDMVEPPVDIAEPEL